MITKDMVVIGQLARPHSIKGEIRVNYYAESPLLLDNDVYLQAGNQPPRPVKVLGRKLWKDTPIIRLEGVEDRTAAELLRGQTLLVASSRLPEADPDEPYIMDILDLPVFLSGSGKQIGTLEDVSFPAGQELWVIRSPEGHEILFPAVPEFVDGIDLDSGRLDISPPPGLLDIYLPDDGEA